MTDFPDLSSLSNNSEVGELLSLPNNSFPYYWAVILFAIWAIATFSMYFVEKRLKGSGNILSSMSIAAFVVMILATLGSLSGFISLQIMVYTLVIGFLIIGIWFFSN